MTLFGSQSLQPSLGEIVCGVVVGSAYSSSRVGEQLTCSVGHLSVPGSSGSAEPVVRTAASMWGSRQVVPQLPWDHPVGLGPWGGKQQFSSSETPTGAYVQQMRLCRAGELTWVLLWTRVCGFQSNESGTSIC